MESRISDNRIDQIRSRLSAISSCVDQGILPHTTTSSLSRSVLGTMLDIFGLTRGAVLVFAEERHVLRLETAIGIGAIDEIPVGDDDVRTIISSRRVSEEITSKLPDAIRFTMPMIAAGQFLGVIALGDRFHSENLDETERMMLSIVNNYLAVWIYNSNLIRRLRTANFELNHRVLQLQMLHEIGLSISSISIDLDELQDQVLTQAVALLNCGGGCILLLDESRQSATITKAFEKEEIVGLKFDIGSEGLTELFGDDGSARELPLNSDLAFGRAKTLAAPISGQHDVLGALIVWDKESRDGEILEFSEEDRTLLFTFAFQAGVAIENVRLYREALEKRQMEADIKAAADIQRHLLPQSDPQLPNLEVSGMSNPCQGVGGDYYGYVQKDGHLIVAIGDVSGKGIQASLMMASLWAGVQAEVGDHDDPSEVASSLNSLMFKTTLPEKYATFCYVDIDTRSGHLRYVNAGHNPSILISPDSEIELLDVGGLPLGMFQNDIAKYSTGHSRLEVGGVLILYTDGVTEATNENGETFDYERLRRIAMETRHLSACEIRESIYREVMQFQGEAPQFDDLTLIVVKRTA